MSQNFWHINGSNLFEKLSDDQLSAMESRARIRAFPKGSAIYHPSDEATSVLLVVEGRVRIGHLTPDGKQAILAFVEPGEIFGEMAILGEDRRSEHAEAIMPSRIVSIPVEVFERVMAQSPTLAVGVTKLIGLRRRRVERRLQSLMFRSNRDRLIQLLIDLADQYGRQDAEGELIGIKLSHQDLASIIGSTRETVTVLLGQLQLDRMIRVGRQRIVIRNRRTLERLLETGDTLGSREMERSLSTQNARVKARKEME